MLSKVQQRSKILQAGQKLTKGNVDGLKYILKDDIGEGVLETIQTGVDLLRELEKMSVFSVDDLSGLKDCLRGINRDDIVDFLEGNETKSKPVNPAAMKKELQSWQPICTDVIDYVSCQLAGDWKRNARFLDIEESTIDRIDLDNRKTQEKAHQSLLWWMRNGKTVNWNVLKEKSLSKIPRWDIIRDAEKNYPDNTINCDADVNKRGRGSPSFPNDVNGVTSSTIPDSDIPQKNGVCAVQDSKGPKDEDEVTFVCPGHSEKTPDEIYRKAELKNAELDEGLQNMAIR